MGLCTHVIPHFVELLSFIWFDPGTDSLQYSTQLSLWCGQMRFGNLVWWGWFQHDVIDVFTSNEFGLRFVPSGVNVHGELLRFDYKTAIFSLHCSTLLCLRRLLGALVVCTCADVFTVISILYFPLCSKRSHDHVVLARDILPHERHVTVLSYTFPGWDGFDLTSWLEHATQSLHQRSRRTKVFTQRYLSIERG